MSKKILIVDDEQNLVKGIRFNLEHQEDYSIDTAYDGQEALDKFEANDYDLILLDLMLPKIDGFDVCQRIRNVSDVPIIMLTAKGDDMDKIMGLEYGADDYMTKPFNMLELKARIKNIFRRTGGNKNESESVLYKSGELTVNTQNRSVEINDVEINLTAKEFDLLLLFMSNKGKVFTREALSEAIWKHVGDIRTVDVHIRRLREKIEADPAKPEYIMTKWGVGYYFANK